jgi:hypothetical protein
VFQCSVGHSLDLQGFEKHDGKRVFNRSTVEERGICTAFHDCVPSISEEGGPIEDGSFQRAFQTAYKEGKFSDENGANNIQRSKTLLNPEYQKMAFRREPFYRMRRNLTCVMEKRKKWAMKIYCLLLVICYLLFRRGAACRQATHRLDPDFSGKQLQGPQFRPEETEEERRRKIKILLNNSATK